MGMGTYNYTFKSVVFESVKIKKFSKFFKHIVKKSIVINIHKQFTFT